MNDNGKTKQQLVQELAAMRWRVHQLEKSEARRNHQEDALCESEELYRILIETTPDPIIMYNLKGDLLTANTQAARTYGVSCVAELLKEVKTVFDFLDEEGKAYAVANFRDTLFNGTAQPREYKLKMRDGRTIPAELHSSLVRTATGEPRAFISVVRDITKRKQAEDALQSLSHVQSLMLDNSIMGIAFVRGRTFEWVNARLSDMFGLPADRIHGSGTRFLFASDEEYAAYEKTIYPALARGEWFEFELTMRRADEKPFTARVIGKAINPSVPGEGSIWILEDITGRKQAEEALRRSESQLSSIIEFLPDATFVIDQEGKVIAWNLAIEQMTGVSKKDMLGLQDRAYMVPFYGKPRRHLMDLIDTHDEGLESRYRDVRRKGNTLYAEAFAPALFQGKGADVFVTAAPIFDDHGNRIGTIESIRDITDFRRAEEELREAHKRLDEIIEYLPDATFVIDKKGKVIAWNKAMEQMTGIAAGDILGKGNYAYALPFYGERRPILIDLVLKSREEIEAKYVHTQRTGMVLDGEAYMPALRGGEVYLAGRATALRDSQGKIVGAIESIRDITARRKAEEKYRGIFENAVMGIFHSTPEGRIIDANPAFARILGYESPEEVVSTITDMARQMYLHPEKRAELLQLMNTQGTLWEHEVEYLRKDGSTALVYVSGRAVRDGAGKLLYYEGTIQDITDRRRLESQLRQAQKMEAIGTLAGGVAHDFNNMLASMMGFTEMAAKETRQDVRRKYHDRVLQACERAKNLVNQILAFSRRREQESRPLDIKLILKEAVNLLRATLPATIEIKKQMTHEETYVLADPTQIHQIAMNLCTNAAHAMREKGGMLDIQLSVIEIHPSGQASHPDLPAGSYVQLNVRDTGHGIEAAILDKIFDPFFTTKKAREGTGLGLSVVYGIVKSCGGAIDVQSTVGQGSTFSIYLPSIHPSNPHEETIPEDVDLQGNERILFVDDEEALVSMAQAYFESLGYSITATVSSAEALRLFQKKPDRFDLVITDMTMPEMTGAELASALLKIRPALPVILCTGYSDSMNIAEARKLNIREFVLKPVPLHELGLLVRRILKS